MPFIITLCTYFVLQDWISIRYIQSKYASISSTTNFNMEMHFPILFRLLWRIQKVMGIIPYKKSSAKNIKFSTNGRPYCIIYNITVMINSVCLFVFSLQSFGSHTVQSVKSLVESIAGDVWMLLALAIHLNQLLKFKYLKKILQYIWNTEYRNIRVGSSYAFLLLIFHLLLLLMFITLDSLIWDLSLVRRIYILVLNFQVEYSFALSTMILHIYTRYISLNLEFLINEVFSFTKNRCHDLMPQLSCSKEHGSNKQGVEVQVPNSEICKISLTPNLGHPKQSQTYCGRQGKETYCKQVLSEIISIRKAMADIHEFFIIPVALMTLWTQIIITGYLLLCFGLGEENEFNFYKLTTMGIHVFEIAFLVDSQHLYNKVVSTKNFPILFLIKKHTCTKIKLAYKMRELSSGMIRSISILGNSVNC